MRVHDIENTWKRFKKKRSQCERLESPINSDVKEYFSPGKREKIIEDLIYLFWLLSDKCFREDEELKKLAFVVSKCKRISG